MTERSNEGLHKDRLGLRSPLGITAFFRVFDIAFFVPGILVYALPSLLGSSWSLDTSKRQQLLSTNVTDITSDTIKLVATIAMIYTTGLLCHAVARLVRRFAHRLTSKRSYHVCLATEMGAYLWNLATLSWNCAVALTLAALLRWKCDSITLIFLGSAALLICQGSEFRSGCRYVQANRG